MRVVLAIALSIVFGVFAIACGEPRSSGHGGDVVGGPAVFSVEDVLGLVGAHVRDDVDGAMPRLSRRLRGPDRMRGLDLQWPTLVDALYGEDGSAPWFVTASGLDERGLVALEVLAASENDALAPADYHVPEIMARVRVLEHTTTSLLPNGLALDQGERAALEAWLGAHEPTTSRRVLAGIVHPTSSPILRVATALRTVRRDREKAAQLLMEIELLCADGLLTYGYDMRHANVWGVNEVSRLAGGDVRAVRRKMLDGFERALHTDMAEYLDGLVPEWEQYGRLKDALTRYRTIEVNGGWPLVQVETRRLPLRVGTSGAPVRALQRRLQVEGFYGGALSGRFDARLRDAVMAYQATHQMKKSGLVEEEELKSLNRSASYRRAQVEVTLSRWRQSRIGDDRYYVHINVPDFHGEVWRDGTRMHRFRTIVGNQERFFSEEKQVDIYRNATPMLSDAIEFIIFNPYWNVTPRIQRELDKAHKDDPGWYKKNDYEVVTRAGVRKVRQKPGPKNALGQVKFQFPNSHDIYLHDTPRRFMFKHAIRSFSHGCVRVDEPLELAQILLANDGRHSAGWRVDRYLSSGHEDWTQLEHSVPIHIEYYTVRVDALRRVHFNADIYGYDKRLVEARLGSGALIAAVE